MSERGEGPSDLDVIISMLKRAGIAFDRADYAPTEEDACAVVRVYEGYPGFFSEFTFRPSGALQSVKAWE